MKKLSLLLIFCLSLTSVTFSQTINSNKSVVDFKIKAGVLFNVNGTFTGMKGDFNFSESAVKTASFDICIDAKSIDTDNTKRDTDLRSNNFFEVETYPTICFKSDSVSKTPDGYSTTGKLTIHGVTKTVTIPFTFENNTFKGKIEINRFEYNIGKDYGTFRVGETATVIITCVVN